MELLERTITIPSKATKLRVYYLYDLHIGAFGFDDALAKKQIRRILNDDYGYCIIGGDVAECIGKKDKRYNPRGVHPMFHDNLRKNNLVGAEISYAKKLLRPLADEQKILAYVEGNHEERMAHISDYNPVEEICEELNIPFGGNNCIHALRIRRAKSSGVRVCLTNAIHGKRGGATTASKVTALERQAIRIRGCHIYVRGHGHVKFMLPGERVGAKMVSGKIEEYAEPEAKGSSGAFTRILKEGGSSYAEDGEYQPTDLGCIYAEITPHAGDGTNRTKMLVELRDLVM